MQLASCVIFAHLFNLKKSSFDHLIRLIPLQVQIACKIIMLNVNKLLFNCPLGPVQPTSSLDIHQELFLRYNMSFEIFLSWLCLNLSPVFIYP
jgi:hypothetical protein